MCRTPFDLPTYRCRLTIERVSDSNVSTTHFETSNITSIVEGFGLDFRALVSDGPSRLFTDIHFDIDDDENIHEVLRELGIFNIEL